MSPLCFSYKAPAKGEGVDYVRTEDEVRKEKRRFFKLKKVQLGSPLTLAYLLFPLYSRATSDTNLRLSSEEEDEGHGRERCDTLD